MIRNTLGSRLAAAAGFLAFFAVVLAGASLTPLQEADGDTAGSYLIISSSELLPAFQDLGIWIRDEGANSLVLSLETVGSRRTPEDRRRLFEYLGDVARGHGYATLIVAEAGVGENASVGESPPWGGISSGIPATGIQYVPVSTLAEAWDFVERCRAGGLPLQESLFAEGDLLSAVPGAILPGIRNTAGLAVTTGPALALRIPPTSR